MLDFVTFENDEAVNVNGTSLQGYIKTDYSTLVEKFGEPTYIGGGDKTTVDWQLLFTAVDEDGERPINATIYDWKLRDTPYGTYDWHIGGFSMDAVDMVEKVVLG